MFAQREERGWARYMSIPSIKAKIEAHGITSLAQFYTSEIKYDPTAFAIESEKIRKCLEEKCFLPNDCLQS
jgi:hypothetical protein